VGGGWDSEEGVLALGAGEARQGEPDTFNSFLSPFSLPSPAIFCVAGEDSENGEIRRNREETGPLNEKAPGYPGAFGGRGI